MHGKLFKNVNHFLAKSLTFPKVVGLKARAVNYLRGYNIKTSVQGARYHIPISILHKSDGNRFTSMLRLSRVRKVEDVSKLNFLQRYPVSNA